MSSKRPSIDWRKTEMIYDKTSGMCAYCGTKLKLWDKSDVSELRRLFDIDHVVPFSKGGNNHIDNLVPSCKSCNSLKRDKTLEQFRVIFGRDFYFQELNT